MKGQQVIMSSGDQDGSPAWETPEQFVTELERLEGPMYLDTAATAKNAKCAHYISSVADAFRTPWATPTYRDGVFCNPPYGKNLGQWVRHGESQAREQRRKVCMLVPAKTDVKWFHEIVWPRANRVYFVRGRIKFHLPGKTNGATFPSMVVVFDGDKAPSADGPKFLTMNRSGE